MLPTPSTASGPSGPAMPGSASEDTLARLLAILGSTFQQKPEGNLTTVFEREVERELGLRSVRVRTVPARSRPAETHAAGGAGHLTFAVPNRDPRTYTFLDVLTDPAKPPDVARVRQLGALAHLAGLLPDMGHGHSAMTDLVHAGEPTVLVGSSLAMRALRDRIDRVAATDVTVLVQGESGTGKELVARRIHELSRRRRGPFVAVNCAAIVDTLLEAELFGIEERTATGVRGRRGKFEHADGGTLFLDEIGDLSLAAQAKLLRALQDLSVERVGTTGSRRVNTRILAATNRPLTQMVGEQRFRADLYYRLNGVEIHVPSLRARREDVRELVGHFLARHRPAAELVVTEAAMDALQLYDWPGNVRELERVVERALALREADAIDLEDLPSQVRGEYAAVLAPAVAAGDTMRAWGSRYARLVFERCGGNKRRACQLLDISYHTLKAYLRYARPDPSMSGANLPAWVRSVSVTPSDPSSHRLD